MRAPPQPDGALSGAMAEGGSSSMEPRVYSPARRTPTESPYDGDGRAVKQAGNGHSERMSIPVIIPSSIYSE
jgi:hypothetical protein